MAVISLAGGHACAEWFGRVMTDPTTSNQSRRLEPWPLDTLLTPISGEVKASSLLPQIVQAACDLTGAERGFAGLIDAARQVVRVEAVYRMPPGTLGSEITAGEGVAGHVLLTGQIVTDGPGGDGLASSGPNHPDETALGVPIIWQSNLIGVLEVKMAPTRQITKVDVTQLTVLANYAALALAHAQLGRTETQRVERLMTLHQIGQLLSSRLSLNLLLRTTAEALVTHFRYASVQVLLVDPDDPRCLVLRAWSGTAVAPRPQLEYRQRIDEGVIGDAARNRQRVYVADVRQDPRYRPMPGSAPAHAQLAVPIVTGDSLVGVLNIEAETPLDEDDIQGLAIIADQLGIAIHNARLFAQMQDALDNMHLLYETSRRIATATDVDAVIAAYLELVAADGRYACNIALYETDETGQSATVVVRGRWTPEGGLSLPLQERYRRTRDGLDPLLDAGRTVMISDVHTDHRVSPELREFQASNGRPALAMIPLLANDQRIGVVVLSAPHVQEWYDADLWPFQATAAHLATIIDSRLQQQLAAERSRQLAVLQERQHLAHELHDSVSQLIFSTTLIAQSLAPTWRRDPAEGERCIARLVELNRLALAEMRALLSDLYPADAPAEPTTPGIVPPSIEQVRQAGLVAALSDLVGDARYAALQINLAFDAYQPQPPEHEEALFRIAQEALHNVLKHAAARQVTIHLTSHPHETRLTVTDDGVGFRPRVSETGGRFGLQTMRERAAALGGTTQVISAPGQGTTLVATLPAATTGGGKWHSRSAS